MDNYQEKTNNQRFGYLLYELVGTIFLVLVFNIMCVIGDSTPGAGKGAYSEAYAMALFAVTFISWDVAPAQFNCGIAVAQLCHNFKEMKDNIKPFLYVVAA